MPSSGKPHVVFFGSGPVSAKSLELLQQNFTIEAIITKPTTRSEMLAVANGTSIHTVANKAELDALIDTTPFQSKVAILIDFGILVSQKVIDSFPLGIVNGHFSLLPQLRGADPISFAILQGLDKTGVSLMLLVEAMDEGPVIACGVHELDGSETTPALTDRLIALSHTLLKTELPRYLAGETKGVDQSKLSQLIPGHPTKPSYSRKLTKTDGVLDFTKPALQLEREIRAFIEWPKSRTVIAGKDVIITKAHAVPSNFSDKPGDIEIVKDIDTLIINCANGYLCIDELKPAGKKEMTTAAFLAGYGHLL